MGKKQKYCCLTLDLEADHAGYARIDKHDGWSETKLDQVKTILEKHDVPLTVFVVGNTIKKKQKQIRLFEELKCEFHLHSFSHDVNQADSLNEIQHGKKVFKDYFGYQPQGYRAPAGKITNAGLNRLGQEGFVFDSSLFPGFWPSLTNFCKNQKIHKPLTNSDIIEVPFSVVSTFHLPLSLSWIKLVGWSFYVQQISYKSMNDLLVFGCHLHDFWRLPAFNSLPPHWKLVYSRNQKNGFYIFEEFIKLMKQKDYQFTTMYKYLSENYL